MLTTVRNALIGALVLGFTGTALAQDPEAGDVAPIEEESSAEVGGETAEVGGNGKPFSAGLLLGYGIAFQEGNVWGVGFGLRGGYNLEAIEQPAIFVGARFVYYLGSDDVNLWEIGIEGGYDIAAGPVIVRPGLGLGLATVTLPDLVGIAGPNSVIEGESVTNPYIALGASVLYDIDEQFFVGGDARIQIVFGDGGDGEALIILANGGMRF